MTAHLALMALAMVLAVNILVCLGRVLLGPTGRDRITGALFAGTTGAGLALIGSVLTEIPALRDIALGFVALAGVIVLVRMGAERFVSRAGSAGGEPRD
ncbi:hypothetical protein [Kocuria sp.]|uniref:hypothetical protein n=1 Tax=Kocuria sp. TaxID=1871328 RepID=UPI0026E07BCB|nr:hypothetical protein [Kocuria sp.]MDO5619619.1 hypothetical protein [Kocuria sp.]